MDYLVASLLIISSLLGAIVSIRAGQSESLWDQLESGPALDVEDTIEALKIIQRDYNNEYELIKSSQTEQDLDLSRRAELASRLEEIRELLDVGDTTEDRCDNSRLKKIVHLLQKVKGSASKNLYISSLFRQQVTICKLYAADRFNEEVEQLSSRDDIVGLQQVLKREKTVHRSSDEDASIANALAAYLRPHVVDTSSFRSLYVNKIVKVCSSAVEKLVGASVADIFAAIQDDTLQDQNNYSETTNDWIDFADDCSAIVDDMSSGAKDLYNTTYERVLREVGAPAPAAEQKQDQEHPRPKKSSFFMKLFGRCFKPKTTK